MEGSNQNLPTQWEITIRAQLEAIAQEANTTPDKVILHGTYASYDGADFYQGSSPIKPSVLRIVRRYLNG